MLVQLHVSWKSGPRSHQIHQEHVICLTLKTGIHDGGEVSEIGWRYADFLTNLPNQGFLGGFVFLAVSPNKVPDPRPAIPIRGSQT